MPGIERAIEKDLGWLRTSVTEADRVTYARDLWPRHHLAVRAGHVAIHKPGAVVWPTSTEDVTRLVRWAYENDVKLVPFGAGSGVCAGVLPTHDVVVVDLKRMDRWRSFEPTGPWLDVEAGHMGVPLEEKLNRRGYTLGHFPSSILCSTSGGWVAARSAGQCSGQYGKIEDMVLALELVTGTGEPVSLQRRAHGPSLLPLVVGSEGTLGIITSSTFRLHPYPSARAFAAWSFPTTEHGWEAMREMFQLGLRPAVSRLYDPFDAMLAKQGKAKSPKKTERKAPGLGALALRQMLKRPGFVNDLLHSDFGGKLMGGAMLLVIFEGQDETPQTHIRSARAICERMGGVYEGEGPAQNWLKHRYSVSYRQAPIFASGAFVDTMEVAARWSQLRGLYDAVRKALGEHAFVMAHLSHAYPDGCCIYFSFAGSAATDTNDRSWDEACERTYDRAWRAALKAAVEAGGTIAHHHGAGRSKAPRLAAELGAGLGVIETVKRVFDPKGIMNPGNLRPIEGR